MKSVRIKSEHKFNSCPIVPLGFKKTSVDKVNVVLHIDIEEWSELKKFLSGETITTVVSKLVKKFQKEVDTTQEKLNKDEITQNDAIEHLEQIRDSIDIVICIINNSIGQMSLGDGKSD